VLSYAQPLNFEWSRQMGGESYDYAASVAVDNLGNVYTAGTFHGTADFDPGPAVFSLTPFGKEDVFISKLDSLGNFVWAKQLGGISYEFLGGLALDNEGNVYTTGGFTNTADFDPGAGTYNLSTASSGEKDIFISKIDVDGNFMWAKRIGDDNNDNGYAIALDQAGNVYTTGVFIQTADFDPGAGEFILTSPDGENGDAFVLKLTSTGDFVWAKQLGGGSYDYSVSIKVDKTNNVYSAGYFMGTVDFDPGPAQINKASKGMTDAYILKLDPSGNLVWALTLGGSDADAAQSLALDGMDNVVITGIFNETVDFDPGAAVFNLSGESDVFVLKLDAYGNFIWVTAFGGPNTWVNSIAIDVPGDIYLSGYIRSTTDFTVIQQSVTLTSEGESDVLIAKLDSNGNFVWVKNIGSALHDEGSGISVRSSGVFYVTGFFKSTVDFDPSDETFNLSAITPDKADIFLLKMNQHETVEIPDDEIIETPDDEVVGIPENAEYAVAAMYPNPTDGHLNVVAPPTTEIIKVTIINNVGELVFSGDFHGGSRAFDLSTLPAGVYFVKQQIGKMVSFEKVVKR